MTCAAALLRSADNIGDSNIIEPVKGAPSFATYCAASEVFETNLGIPDVDIRDASVS